MSFLTGLLYVLVAIAVLLFMIMVHEFGHYIVGKLLKFKIEEFSIGFGKPLFSHTSKKGEKFSIRIFPLGGYCAFKGEGDEEKDGKIDKDSFNAQKPWKRILVFFAGVTMNFLTAVLFSLILLCTVGYDVVQIKDTSVTATTLNNKQVSYTAKNLQSGDVVVKVDGTKVDFAFGDMFQNLIKKQQDNAKKWVESGNDINDFSFKMTVRRDGKEMDVDCGMYFVQDYQDGVLKQESYLMGITFNRYIYSFGEALARCWSFAFGLAWIVLKSLWLLITFQLDLSMIGGPITTITTIASTTQASWLNLLILIPAISANLAVFNILPIPALDGAHVVFTLIEWIRGKPIKRELENKIHFIGLCVLFAFVIIVDILHFVL